MKHESYSADGAFLSGARSASRVAGLSICCSFIECIKSKCTVSFGSRFSISYLSVILGTRMPTSAVSPEITARNKNSI